MGYHLIFRPRAFSEIQESYDYYESKEKGLGKRFIEVLDVEFNYITQYPKHIQTVRKEFRQKPIEVFPYLIIYKIIDESIIIYSIFHTSRNPKDKFKK